MALVLSFLSVLMLFACGNGNGDGQTEGDSALESAYASETRDAWEETTVEIPEVSVEVGETDARVTNSNGLSYTVSGYDAVTDGGFDFVSGLTFTFDEGAFAENFNRFTLTYKATEPVHIYVTYHSGIGAEIVDDYYLEAGEGAFSGLIVDYIQKKKGADLTEIVVDTCKGKTASFTLYHAETEMYKVYTGDFGSKTFYIDNGRFKLGVDMGWGGTINYMEDLSKKVDGLTNLVNKHDTGRLIQQSYYGTGAIEGEFEWGSFNGSDKWPYNPVQGGGQGNSASRLVDVVVGDNYVYIKAQPMDWGKVGSITPSYMENYYILEEDYIRVDNRFVDFSGWEHPFAGQELPALYTVSYLDTFIWYGGVKPWTGDAVSVRDDLNFWGDSKYVGDCTFPIRENNTETWCAWINTDIDFGIGLYVPNVDRLKAGRYVYNGSKGASDNPTNYVAPYNTMKLVSYEPLEYSYLLTTGTAEEIRATFTEHKDFSTNESLHKNYVSGRLPSLVLDMTDIDFTVEENSKVFTMPNNAEAFYDEAQKAVKLIANGYDPYLYMNYALSDKTCYAEDYDAVEIVYMIPTSNANSSYSCQLFTCTGEQTGATGSMVVGANLIKDGAYHTVTFPVKNYSFWKGRINQLRFDFFDAVVSGDVMYVKSVKLIKGEGGGNAPAISVDGTRLDFSKQENAAAFCNPKDTVVSYDSKQEAAKLTVTAADDVHAAISFDIFPDKVPAEQFPVLKIEYMIPEGNGLDEYECDLFLCAGDITSPNGDARVRESLIADGKYHTLEVNLAETGYWNGEIHMIRFDYFDKCKNGDVMYVKSMELVK